MNQPVPLNIDAVKVDNQLAIDYLKKNNSAFHSFGLAAECNTDKYVLDNYADKIYYTDPNYFKKHIQTRFEACTDKAAKMRELAKKIEENTELFSQLENLIRGRCKDEVKNCDIKLIVQNLLYWSTQTEQISMPIRYIVMAEDTPLAMLGLVAQLLKADTIELLQYIVIEATRNTAAVCYLFAEICQQVGLSPVFMIVLENSETLDLNKFDELQAGCTGVVTNHSDIDSAVDALLSSSRKYPWKLRRILIQESIYESVKTILEWKCNLKLTDCADDSQVNKKFGQKCSEVFVYGDKKFLLDYAGQETDIGEQKHQVILVQAYRTSKELLSLLAQYNPFYLSLWSSDIAEANEIAFGVHASIVWINDFGTFDGPRKASQAFYSIIQMKMSGRMRKMSTCPKLDTLRQAWSKLDYYKRVGIVKNAVESYVKTEKDLSVESANFVKDLTKLIDFWNPKEGDLVDIQKGKMYIVIDNPIEVIAINDRPLSSSYCSDYIEVMKSLIAGKAVLIQNSRHLGLFQIFVQRGLPVLITDNEIYEFSRQGSYMALGGPCHLTRAVYKNFGTIFAN